MDFDCTNIATASALSCFSGYFGNVLLTMIPLIGLISFIMILVGGFTILTSGGNPEGIKKGGQTITYAIAGLVLSIIAWLVLVFIEQVTGVRVTWFNFSFNP